MLAQPFYRSRFFYLSALATLVLALGVGIFWLSTRARAAAPVYVNTAAMKMPVSADIEAQWGLRPILVALTAAGGMVDFRYTVLDVDKANGVHADLSTYPYFVTSDGKELHLPETMAHHPNLETGRTYYILYPNTGNVIKPGTEVTLVIGNLKLEHVPVR